ncbi:MAG: ABC transporter permease [Clostridia bacterium]|nr:ABC transporter permease [Clostridia bacterium]
MLKLIKSDFYKLFRMKSFYICGVLAAIFAGIGILALDAMDKMQYALYGLEDMFTSQCTGIYSLTMGVGSATLFTTIIVSMFTASEFRFGTIKNIASRGVNRAWIYFSKYIVTIFVSVAYTLVCALAAFIVGCCLAGVGDFDRNIFLDILEVLGLFILAQIAMQSIFQMMGFIIRSTGWTIGANIAIFAFLRNMVLDFIDMAVNNWLAPAVASVDWLSSWLKIENFSSNNYWPFPYLSQFTNMDIFHMDFFYPILTRGLIVCAVYIIVTTAIGIWTFQKRDID